MEQRHLLPFMVAGNTNGTEDFRRRIIRNFVIIHSYWLLAAMTGCLLGA